MSPNDEQTTTQVDAIRAELERQRQQIANQIKEPRRSTNAAGERSGLATASVSDEFPRSVTMRLLLDHPEWVIAAVSALMYRLGLPSSVAVKNLNNLLNRFLTGFRQS